MVILSYHMIELPLSSLCGYLIDLRTHAASNINDKVSILSYWGGYGLLAFLSCGFVVLFYMFTSRGVTSSPITSLTYSSFSSSYQTSNTTRAVLS